MAPAVIAMLPMAARRTCCCRACVMPMAAGGPARIDAPRPTRVTRLQMRGVVVNWQTPVCRFVPGILAVVHCNLLAH